MRFFRAENRFWKKILLFADILLLGMLWIVLTLTVVGFGPASTALYYTIAKAIRRERGRPFATFFSALKQNWWKSMIVGLVLELLMAGLMMLDFSVLAEPFLTGDVSNDLSFFGAVLRLVLLLTISMHLFPVLSRFQISVPKTAVLSIMLVLRHLGKSLALSIILLILFVVSYFFHVAALVAPGLFTYYKSFREERILKQYILDAGIDISGEEDPWYME